MGKASKSTYESGKIATEQYAQSSRTYPPRYPSRVAALKLPVLPLPLIQLVLMSPSVFLLVPFLLARIASGSIVWYVISTLHLLALPFTYSYNPQPAYNILNLLVLPSRFTSVNKMKAHITFLACLDSNRCRDCKLELPMLLIDRTITPPSLEKLSKPVCSMVLVSTRPSQSANGLWSLSKDALPRRTLWAYKCGMGGEIRESKEENCFIVLSWFPGLFS